MVRQLEFVSVPGLGRRQLVSVMGEKVVGIRDEKKELKQW